MNYTTTPTAAFGNVWLDSRDRIIKQSGLLSDQLILDETQREATRDMVAENRWSLPGSMTGKKGAGMALLLQKHSGLAPNRGRCDAPPRCVLPLVVI